MRRKANPNGIGFGAARIAERESYHNDGAVISAKVTSITKRRIETNGTGIFTSEDIRNIRDSAKKLASKGENNAEIARQIAMQTGCAPTAVEFQISRMEKSGDLPVNPNKIPVNEHSI